MPQKKTAVHDYNGERLQIIMFSGDKLSVLAAVYKLGKGGSAFAFIPLLLLQVILLFCFLQPLNGLVDEVVCA